MEEQTEIASAPRKISWGEFLAVPTERPGEFYLSLLALDKKEIGGKTILNIGAGGSDLEADLKEFGGRVINCDLRYKRGKNGQETKSALVAGDMTQVPLQDNSVDIVVALYATGHPPKKLDKTTLTEMVRVAREKVIVYPCREGKEAERLIQNDSILKQAAKLERQGINLKLITAGMDKKGGFFHNLNRLIKNLYYLDVETIGAKLFRAKRLSLDVKTLKEDGHWREKTNQLIAAGLSLRAG